MRVVLQRVKEASVTVDGAVVGRIGPGLLALLGVARDDSEKDADWLAGKVAGMRIFSDAQGRFNLSVAETGGEVLVISQFTLYGDASKGRRPSFDLAAPPDIARKLYNYFVESLGRMNNIRVSTGVFQAHMDVYLVNDGPVTLVCDSKK